MKCPYCGAEIEDGVKFCTNCGKSLAEDEELQKLGDEPPKKQLEKVIRILVIAAAVIITVIVGVTLGMRSFMDREYKKGVQAYQSQDYETAIGSLNHAVRWGQNNDAYIMIADSYYRIAQFEKAYETYEIAYKNFSDNEDVIKGYAETCEKLAYEAIAANDAEKAVTYLKKEYELTDDEVISRRIKAIEGGGSYADEHGNVYNLAGLLETAVCYDEKGNELYRAELIYDLNGKWQFAKAYQNDSVKKTVFGTFAWDDTEEFVLSVYPSGKDFSWLSEKTEINSDQYIKRLTSVSEVSRYILDFSYSHNSKGILERETITSSSGEKMEIEWTGEEYPDHAILNIDSQRYIAVFTYTPEGKIASMTVTKNFLQTVYSIENTYNDDGTIHETVIRNNSMPLTVWKPSVLYQRTVTEYSAHQPVSRTVYDESGALIARGYYTDGCGWLMMYTGN